MITCVFVFMYYFCYAKFEHFTSFNSILETDVISRGTFSKLFTSALHKWLFQENISHKYWTFYVFLFCKYHSDFYTWRMKLITDNLKKLKLLGMKDSTWKISNFMYRRYFIIYFILWIICAKKNCVFKNAASKTKCKI